MHIVLALALLLFSWVELEHSTDLDAHHGGGSCAVCVFASPLGNGITPAATLFLPSPQVTFIPQQTMAAAILPQPYRHTLGQRGPPPHS
ncbi:MAG: hypothetical protein AB1450_06045 [Pseudomonadota bacterium]